MLSWQAGAPGDQGGRVHKVRRCARCTRCASGAQGAPGAPGAQGAPGAPRAPEQRLFFADYRDVDGLKLPFRIRRAAGTETTEETTFDRYRINARVDPRRFDTKRGMRLAACGSILELRFAMRLLVRCCCMLSSPSPTAQGRRHRPARSGHRGRLHRRGVAGGHSHGGGIEATNKAAGDRAGESRRGRHGHDSETRARALLPFRQSLPVSRRGGCPTCAFAAATTGRC